jgi:arginine exporter protein ArgO
MIVLKLFSGFAVNVSAGYFMVAAIGAGNLTARTSEYVQSLLLNMLFAIIYFIAAIKIEEII